MTGLIPRKERRVFTPEFKSQIVHLYQNRKRKYDILREYDLCAPLLDKWIKQNETKGPFTEKDNRTDEENELIELRKRNKQRLQKSMKHALDEGKCDKV